MESGPETPIKETRVHGVSGTPPRDMLNTDPIPRLDGDKYTRIFRKRPSLDSPHPSGRPYDTEAFHWGSLTTGHWLTSLWILLAPFALANVAGWMALRRSALQRAAIRLAGLALTCLFVAQIGYVVVAVPNLYAIDNGWSTTSQAWVRAVVGLGYVLVLGALVLRLSTQSHFEPLDYRQRFRLLFAPSVSAMRHPGATSDTWGDPAAAKVTDSEMWEVHSIVHRLRRIHFAAGQLVIALILARLSLSDPMKAVAIAGLGVVVILLIATTYAPTNRTVLTSTAWITLIAEVVAIGAVIIFYVSSAGIDLDSIHRTTFHIAIALGVSAGLAISAGIPPVGALTFATFLGGAFGVGAGLIAEDILSVPENLISQGGAWVAPASLVFVLFVLTLGMALAFVGEPELAEDGLVNRALTRLTKQSRILLAGAAAFGLLAGAKAIYDGCITTTGMCQPDALTDLPGADTLVAGLLVAVLLMAAALIGRFKPFPAGVAVVLAAALTWVTLADPMFGEFQPSRYIDALPLARTLIFVAPVIAIGRSVLGAYRQGASSRKVGVLWDVASFWPRWFHPLGPPAYGPKVVNSLSAHIKDDRVDVLAGHSQGSVIAAVATHQACTSEGHLPSGLLTYGSPIGLLYARLFPDTGMQSLVNELPGKLSKGWANLRRDDDPIGGEVLGGDVAPVVETDGSGHSGYELSRAFRQTRDNLVV